MKKIFTILASLVLIFLISISLALLTTGIETKRFNKLVLNKINEIDNKINVKIVLIIGDEEFKKTKVSYKNLENGSQLTLSEKELFEKIKNE